MDSDSLTGEDSLLDCSLLSNPTADLLEEFVPLAISAPAHKGKFYVRPTCVPAGEQLNTPECFSYPVFFSSVSTNRLYGKLEFVLLATVL